MDAALSHFFPKGIAVERACENVETCTTDMVSFKGYVHRWLSQVTHLAAFTQDKILPVLANSTAAAIAQCTGGDTGRACGFKWASGEFDGNVGAGQTMNVLAAVSALLMEKTPPPLTAKSGGTSKGNPDAGSKGDTSYKKHDTPVTTADKAGASIITVVLLAGAVAMFSWISLGK